MLSKIQKYKTIIDAHLEDSVENFLLKNPAHLDNNSLKFVAEQIQAKQKAKHKLTDWYHSENIIYPPPLSIEQASSSQTAAYKASWVSGSLIDLTGGMGIDAANFTSTCDTVIYIEKNEKLAEIARYNFEVLGLKNIQVFATNCLNYLAENKSKVDWIYLDPARRNANRDKVISLEDCEPNVLTISNLLQINTHNILLKTSPILDIHLAIKQLKIVQQVHVIAVDNEVKELLFFMSNSDVKEPLIKTINFQKNKTQTFEYFVADEKNINSTFLAPQRYIYEPNAAVLKAGAFKSIGKYYKLSKIAPNSHLYSSEVLLDDFCGRVFDLQKICKFDKREVQEAMMQNKHANVAVRNFPLKADEVKKKLDLKDGGDFYIFATTDNKSKKIVLICKKIY